ncbi:hypothetical protein D1872_278220 [compost metagenome]
MNGTRSSSPPTGIAAGADAAGLAAGASALAAGAGAAAAPPFLKASTSSRVILPALPVPVT